MNWLLSNLTYWKGSCEVSYLEYHRQHHKNKNKREYDVRKMAKTEKPKGVCKNQNIFNTKLDPSQEILANIFWGYNVTMLSKLSEH